MPAVSKQQFKAMAAACRGNSKLGISRKVGCEFVHSTTKPKFLPRRSHSMAKKGAR